MNPNDPTVVARLWTVQQGACFHCGELMLNSGSSNHGLYWSREHVYPRSRNGSTYGNVVLAHRKCNSARGNPEPSEEELARARLIIAAVGQEPFKFVDPTLGKALGVWPRYVAAKAKRRSSRVQTAAVGHDVRFGEFQHLSGTRSDPAKGRLARTACLRTCPYGCGDEKCVYAGSAI